MATKTRELADFILEEGMSDADLGIQGKPHIRPGTLQPAVAGKLLDGSTSHSGAYGTAQADGFSYYYTDIKGSKPIKDPRIGAHFGSQRHKFKSTQKLLQETAIHGESVYSIDGREWIRIVGAAWEVGGLAKYNNDGVKLQIYNDSSAFIEIVGYFNDANLLFYGDTNTDKWNTVINGGTQQAQDLALSHTNPLIDRYVDAGSLVNLSFNAAPTLGINTLKIYNATGSTYFNPYGIELIAHGLFTDATCDTTNGDATITHDASTKMVAGMSVTGTGIAAGTTIASVTSTTAFELSANATATNANQTLTFGVADLSIPAQNVVSYGKKFALSAAAHHYDPFNGFTNGTSLHSAFVDTATSLGLDSAPGSSASWAISNSNNIRPYNGGRVVKWIASDGTIKTSVTMMPPNAQNIKTTASNEIATPSATNTTTTPNMSDDAIDYSLSEVAKTYHWREFGNGAANEGEGMTNNNRQASMLKDSAHDICYVMDDGLTSLVGNDVRCASDGDLRPEATDNDWWASTFIGTGVSIITTTYAAGTYQIASNLPYGTHLLKVVRDADTTPDMYLDGLGYADVSGGTYGCMSEITFYQPKKPPIPDNACIIADYMLMADFVRQAAPTVTSAPWDPDHTLISKGVRMCSPSRDTLWQETTGGYVFSFDVLNTGPGGFYLASSATGGSGAQNNYVELPAFGNNIVIASNNPTARLDLYINGSDVAQTDTSGHNMNDITYPNAAVTLGMNTFRYVVKPNQDYAPYVTPRGFMIVSPIHTSSHYQTFETPFLRELVGGDRNMEQTNLVVTGDGKTWDAVTRDTSYIGNQVALLCRSDGSSGGSDVQLVLDVARGHSEAGTNSHDFYMKDEWVLAHNRLICLIDGEYTIHAHLHGASGSDPLVQMYKNTVAFSEAWHTNSAETLHMLSQTLKFNRGDYIKILTRHINGTSGYRNNIAIIREN